MPLPPSAELKRKATVVVDGKSETGPLVADGEGVAVDVRKKAANSTLLRPKARITRHYLARWSEVTSYDISPPSQHNLGGTTINSNSAVLTLTTPRGPMAWDLRGGGVAQWTTALGPLLAQIKGPEAAG